MMGFEKLHEFNVRWLGETRRVLKPGGTLWISGTHHLIFSLGFALQRLGFRIINDHIWVKNDPPPNALHTTFTHAHARRNTAPASGDLKRAVLVADHAQVQCLV